MFERDGADRALAFDRTKEAGASMVRLQLIWRNVAPAGSTKPPPPFDPTNHEDGLYRQDMWQAFDEQVRAATARGLEPIVYIQSAPDWAEGNGSGPPGTVRPSPAEFGAFAKAAATRYSGAFASDLLVRYWQAWNEPNRGYFLSPQAVNGKAFAPGWYRAMVNAFTASVRAVDAENIVIAGGLAPYGRRGHLAPMAFMRSMLCMSVRRPARPICGARSSFDYWAHNPYACGGPTRQAFSANDIAIADLPEMRALLRAAIRWNRVRHRVPVQFWATEVAWDTRPPDPGGVPLGLHARWVAEALYRMWRSGVTVATWFPLQDYPFASGSFQSGLYFANGTPKTRSLRAFSFPFVAYRRAVGRIFVWGRTPPGATNRTVVIERKTPAGWRPLVRSSSASSGIFTRTFRSSVQGSLRASVITDDAATLASTAFSLRQPRYPYLCPFGSR